MGLSYFAMPLVIVGGFFFLESHNGHLSMGELGMYFWFGNFHFFVVFFFCIAFAQMQTRNSLRIC